MDRLGIDLVEIIRIKRLLKKPKFISKVFTPKEIEYFKLKNMKAETVAGSFAAKEAVSKVFGTGIGRLGFKDIEILRTSKGKPYVRLSQEGWDLARFMGLEGIELSISHERSYALAVATGRDLGFGLIEKPQGLPRMYPRNPQGHKGDFGKVGLIGGSEGMAGSIMLSTMAALRTGSGLVYTLVPQGISSVIQAKSLENIVYSFKGQSSLKKDSIVDLQAKAQEMDALGFGPGLGREEDILDILSAVLDLAIPTVVDADGLFAASKNVEILKDKEVIITPHMGEMARLLGRTLEEVQENPMGIAIDTARIYNITVILKGPRTIVTDGSRVYINKTGNSGMASGGSGDVLTGIVTSLLGQGYGLYEAGVLGVYVHGLAGDFAARDKGEDSLIARDIISNLSNSIKVVRQWN